MTRVTLRTCRVQYPGGSKRVHLSIASPFTRPSPLWRRVGIRTSTFETCSDFTHVTARSIAQPPKAAFVTRLQPSRLPSQTARQLPEQIDNSPGGSCRHWSHAPSGRTPYASLSPRTFPSRIDRGSGPAGVVSSHLAGPHFLASRAEACADRQVRHLEGVSTFLIALLLEGLGRGSAALNG